MKSLIFRTFVEAKNNLSIGTGVGPNSIQPKSKTKYYLRMRGENSTHRIWQEMRRDKLNATVQVYRLRYYSAAIIGIARVRRDRHA